MSDKVYIGRSAIDLNSSPALDPISRVRLVVSEDAEYVSGDNSGRTIEIECPWGTKAMADNLIASLGGYSYQPLDVQTAFNADPLWELGDGVTVNGLYSQIVGMPTSFGLKYNADIEAPESEEINHEYPYQDKGTRDIERKIAQSSASLRIGIDEIESIVKGIAQPYVEGTLYTPNAIVYKDGKYYSCNVAAGQTSSATWVDDEWTEQSSGALSSIIKQTMDSLTFSVSSGTNQSTITIKANGVDVASPVVRFNRIEADEVSADGISAGTISALQGGSTINFNGRFNYYSGNNLAGKFGAVSSGAGVNLLSLQSANGKAALDLFEANVGTSVGTVAMTGGLRLDPNFIVNDIGDLPNASLYNDGTIGIVVL